MEKIIEYFNGDDLAASVWNSKYALETEKTPEDMHLRMASEFARMEEQYVEKETELSDAKRAALSEYGRTRKASDLPKIFSFLDRFNYIIPQGSIMATLGTDQIASLSNCVVLPKMHDSYSGIMYADSQLTALYKRRCGVGTDISPLRPEGMRTNNAANSSTGAHSFMERFSNTTREVAMNGRRGALMLTIDVRHPGVFKFVNIKKDLTKVTGANISVMLRDDFMEAVQNNDAYYLRYPCEAEVNPKLGHEFDVPFTQTTDDGTEVYIVKIRAKKLYDEIVENAWENAEPGQMFVDRHHDRSPDSVYELYKGHCTNPCGEIFMNNDSCRLLALNLFSFVNNPFTDKAEIDYERLYIAAYEQQRMADQIVELELEYIQRIIDKIESDPEPAHVKQIELDTWKQLQEIGKKGRRTGCGFTALGDTLAALGLKYDSTEAKEVITKIMKTKMEGELDCTVDLSIAHGPFYGWSSEAEYEDWEVGVDFEGEKVDKVALGKNHFFNMLIEEFPLQVERMRIYGRRNVSWSTVAPTGTVSLMAQVTSGLEPLFSAYYMRRKKVNPNDKNVRVDFTDQNGDHWQEYPVLHPKFKKWCLTQKGAEKVNIDNLSKEKVDQLFFASPWHGSTANDIDWIERVEIQSIIQKYTTHSISSTINLPNDVTKEEVANIYIESFNKGLKGVTIYRDGCRTGVLVTADTKQDEGFVQHDAPKRPRTLPAEIHKLTVQKKKWNVIVGLLEGKPYEVFATRYFTSKKNMDITKVKSGLYNLTIDDEVYAEDVTSEMSGEEQAFTRIVSTSLRHGADIKFIVEQLNKTESDLTSFSKAIARVLKKYIPDGTSSTEKLEGCERNDCNLIYEEGCVTCKSCGKSRC